MGKRDRSGCRYLNEREIEAFQKAASRVKNIIPSPPLREALEAQSVKQKAELDDMRRQRDAFRDDAIYWFKCKINRGR